MILLGEDFNCPGIDWSTSVLTDSYLTRSFRALVSLTHDFLLEQVNTNPTRGPNVLDLCFTSHPDCITQWYTALGLSDHEAVIVDLANTIPTRKKCFDVTFNRIFYYSYSTWFYYLLLCRNQNDYHRY